MIDYYKKTVFENYANFTGRARRSEYWYFVLSNIIIFILLLFPAVLMEEVSPTAAVAFWVLMVIYGVLILIPGFALIVRRLHDIGKSGWYWFVRFIPIVGPIWLLVLLCTEGNRGRNQYGHDPKYTEDEIDEIGTNVY
nr:DUF805 domain-containing protein [uncultured Flavobacterium sp.]